MRRAAFRVGSICLLAALFSGCKTVVPEDFSVVVRDLVLVNRSDVPASRIVLSIPISRQKVRCSYIPAHGRQILDYPTREYSGSYVVVSWRCRGRMWHSEPEAALTPPGLERGQPVDLVVTLGEGGKMKIEITQDARAERTPNRKRR